MSYSVAIVGRPNVGKSTLFNRMTGRKRALVDAIPGLTRDRREGTADLGGRTITLIDTAGLEDADPNSIEGRMRAQSERAVAEADLILFVVDGKQGIVPADHGFAELVRATGKRVLLVANKSETRRDTSGYFEAYELGFGDPIAISAEHGEGIGELVTAIESSLPVEEAAASAAIAIDNDDTKDAGHSEKPLRVAIIGRPNAGKSTLVNALLGEHRMIVGPEPGLTRDSIEVPLQWGSRKIALFDTAGLRKKARIVERPEQLAASDALNAIRFSEVVVLLIDSERALEKQDLQLGDLVESEGRALVIAINKWDLVVDKQARLKELRERVAEHLPQLKGIRIVTLSALSGRGLDKLMVAVFDTDTVWNRRVPTHALNRWLEQMTTQHSPPQVAGRRLRLRYMTQANARPPTFIVFCSRPEALPKSYLRYLSSGLRDAFDFPGVPLRVELRKGHNPYSNEDR